MSSRKYLSYSGFKKLDCKYAYWHDYINHTNMGIPDDRLGSIYGSVVGKLFEDFYVEQLWKQPQPQAIVMSRVDATVDGVLKRETSPWKNRLGGVLLWKGEGEGKNPKGMYASRDELAADVRDTVPRGFRIIRNHRLLGRRADAEFKLDFVTLEGHTIGGRADFIIERNNPHNDLLIVDGKGSRHRGKYVDPQQLLWYAMLMWLHSAKEGKPRIPDKLAFLFWRYEPEECMDWIEVTEGDVRELYEHVLDTINEIQKMEKMLMPNPAFEGVMSVFKPKPNEKNCRFCPYASVCPPGSKVQERIK